MRAFDILLFAQRRDSEQKCGPTLRPSAQRTLRRIVALFSLLSKLNPEENRANAAVNSSVPLSHSLLVLRSIGAKPDLYGYVD